MDAKRDAQQSEKCNLMCLKNVDGLLTCSAKRLILLQGLVSVILDFS